MRAHAHSRDEGVKIISCLLPGWWLIVCDLLYVDNVEMVQDSLQMVHESFSRPRMCQGHSTGLNAKLLGIPSTLEVWPRNTRSSVALHFTNLFKRHLEVIIFSLIVTTSSSPRERFQPNSNFRIHTARLCSCMYYEHNDHPTF